MSIPRTILVTGAGRGLGKAISLGVAELGWHCWVADINLEQATRTAEEIREAGGQACPIEVDIASPESVERLVFRLEETGPIHGLVNCAALADGVGGNAVHEIPVADWDRILGVNLRGSFLMTRAVAPLLISSGGGTIVNIGSDAAANGSANLAHYITSKGGLAALTRASATDLGPHGITVNTVSPGLTVSESAAEVPEKRHLEYQNQRALKREQLPADIVGIVTFLVSPAASYITGQEILVNGGFVYR
ncbi:SDR family NAD(P)-dependent oxidoreductase [Corynebacterium halotolerans]|uniref:SDR family NAD(P)-dependent oxidoreductase n=1 Tax=Corynebacterium halotolerans TaxID=225326 RepID=UPI003CF0B5F4